MFDSGKAVIRILGAIVGIGFFAWVISVSIAGPAAMNQLEEFEQKAGEAQAQYREAQREELRDSMLAEEGWGSQAHVDMPTGDGDLRGEALEMLDEAEDGWGVGAR